MGAALNELKNFDIPTYNPDPCGAPDAAGEAVKLAGFKLVGFFLFLSCSCTVRYFLLLLKENLKLSLQKE